MTADVLVGAGEELCDHLYNDVGMNKNIIEKKKTSLEPSIRSQDI